MNIIDKLPDDIILYIYTKCLKRYRMHEGRLIKLIDLDKYCIIFIIVLLFYKNTII